MARILCILLSATFVLLSQGCASGGGEILKIDMKEVLGRQHMPDELTDMFRDLGYDWIPIADPNSRREVKTVQQDGEYRMRFEHVQAKQVRIDVRIRIQDGFTRLHFYEPAGQTLSASSRALLSELQQRVTMEFGAANVTY